jgi:hypothetical protein
LLYRGKTVDLVYKFVQRGSFEIFVEPFLEDIDFESDDGWSPGCELLGDDQMSQDKNMHKYYRSSDERCMIVNRTAPLAPCLCNKSEDTA